jgi:hypothetical protein
MILIDIDLLRTYGGHRLDKKHREAVEADGKVLVFITRPSR